jgi:hypothetical protein
MMLLAVAAVLTTSLAKLCAVLFHQIPAAKQICNGRIQRENDVTK